MEKTLTCIADSVTCNLTLEKLGIPENKYVFSKRGEIKFVVSELNLKSTRSNVLMLSTIILKVQVGRESIRLIFVNKLTN